MEAKDLRPETEKFQVVETDPKPESFCRIFAIG